MIGKSNESTGRTFAQTKAERLQPTAAAAE